MNITPVNMRSIVYATVDNELRSLTGSVYPTVYAMQHTAIFPTTNVAIDYTVRIALYNEVDS